MLIGDGPLMAQLRADIETAAQCDAKVLIVGETGVGKEVVARLVHNAGLRRQQRFVAINCAGLPDSLLESELFGHVRESFTGAYRDKLGLAALADRGTLFLDELGEMSARDAGDFLRFAETLEIHRLGADRIDGRVDVRIIAATNRNLLERMASGDFREDLYSSAQRHSPHRAASAGARDRHSAAVQSLSGALLRHPRVRDSHRSPGDRRDRARLRLAGQRTRIEERRRAPCGAASWRSARSRRAAGGNAPAGRSATGRGRGPRCPGCQCPCRSAIPAADAAWAEMVVNGKSFWTVVHPLFIDRELTKTDVREIIRRGLEQTQGSYRKLVDLFHMMPGDYKRFLAFLYQHDCHLPFHPFREPRSEPDTAAAAR